MIGPPPRSPPFPCTTPSESRDRHSRRSPRDPEPLAPHAAPPRAPARARRRHPLAHLLQVRGDEPRRQPQAEHGGGAGVLQQEGDRKSTRLNSSHANISYAVF